MSIFGKFLAEFSPGDWSFVWTMHEERVVGAPASTSTTLSCSFSTGDSAGDMLSFLSTLKSRMSTALRVQYSTAAYPEFLAADSDLYPTTLVYTTEYYDAGAQTTSISVTNNAVALAAGGWNQASPTAIYNLTLDRVNFTTTDSTLLSVLGFDGTETVQSGYAIVSNSAPRYCWFPGRETYGTASGGGVTSDSGWVPVDAHSRIVSGAGNMRIVGPSRLQYKRTLRFEALKRSEVVDSRHTGPIAFFDIWATSAFHWYPDRDAGTTTTAGTRGDPGPSSYHTDSDCDYWRCMLAEEPRIAQASDPDWFTVTIELNGEPA